MQETCCSQDSGTDVCQSSQSGTMCKPSTENRGEVWLTLYRAAFHVKTFHQPEKEQESREQEADSGKKWHELSVKYDLNTHLWRTHRCLFDEDLPQSSVTLPKWGMMRLGVLYRLHSAAHPMKESEFGFWPTPIASDWKNYGPTQGNRKSPNLSTVIHWPTPRANDAEKRGNIANNPRNGLPAAVKHWPKPRTQMSRPVKARADQKKGHKSNLEEVVAIEGGLSGGTLNPTWVEYRDWETDRKSVV